MNSLKLVSYTVKWIDKTETEVFVQQERDAKSMAAIKERRPLCEALSARLTYPFDALQTPTKRVPAPVFRRCPATFEATGAQCRLFDGHQDDCVFVQSFEGFMADRPKEERSSRPVPHARPSAPKDRERPVKRTPRRMVFVVDAQGQTERQESRHGDQDVPDRAHAHEPAKPVRFDADDMASKIVDLLK